MRRAAVALSFVAPLIASVPAIAGDDFDVLSKATLTYDITSITCALTTPGGSTNVPCDSLQWTVTLERGWSATVSATYNWHYTDDGLPVERGTLFDPRSFGGVRPVGYESAGIYVQGVPACPRGSCTSRPPIMSGDAYSPMAVFESDNTVPDDITGSRTVFVTATWSSDDPVPSWTGSFGIFPIGTWVNSSPAAPIPEPSTWALFSVSLAALAFMRGRARIAKKD